MNSIWCLMSAIVFWAAQEKDERPAPVVPPPPPVLEPCGQEPIVRQWIAFSADSKSLLALRADGVLRVLDCDGNKEIRRLQFMAPTGGLFTSDPRHLANATFSRDARRLAIHDAYDLPGILTVHDSSNGTKVFRIEDIRPGVSCFSPDGGKIAVATSECSVKIFDLVGRRPAQLLVQKVTDQWTARDEITSLDFSGNGKRLAVAFSNGVVTVWDVPNHSPVFSRDIYFKPGSRTALPQKTWQQFASIASPLVSLQTWDMGVADCRVIFSPRENVLAWMAGHEKIRLLRAVDGEEVCRFETGKFAAFSSDGQQLVIAPTRDYTINNPKISGGFVIWQLAEKRRAKSVSAGLDDALQSIAFSPDGHRFAVAKGDGTIRVWDLERVSE